MDYQRIGTLIYGVQRLASMVEHDKIAQFPRTLADRIAVLSTQRDAIVNTTGELPDTRLDAALRAMEDINTDVAAWRLDQGQ
jgi:hypothetical protein